MFCFFSNNNIIGYGCVKPLDSLELCIKEQWEVSVLAYALPLLPPLLVKCLQSTKRNYVW